MTHEAGLDVIGAYMSPVHDKYGKKGLLPSNHRAEMAKECDKDSNWISFDPWEMEQNDWSRTRVALEHFDKMVKKNQLYPENVRVVFICGADVLDSFNVPGKHFTPKLKT
jgi:nicotinamide mononucleotide adenylyltransferase